MPLCTEVNSATALYGSTECGTSDSPQKFQGEECPHLMYQMYQRYMSPRASWQHSNPDRPGQYPLHGWRRGRKGGGRTRCQSVIPEITKLCSSSEGTLFDGLSCVPPRSCSSLSYGVCEWDFIWK